MERPFLLFYRMHAPAVRCGELWEIYEGEKAGRYQKYAKTKSLLAELPSGVSRSKRKYLHTNQPVDS